jgi:hypothetical protein
MVSKFGRIPPRPPTDEEIAQEERREAIRKAFEALYKCKRMGISFDEVMQQHNLMGWMRESQKEEKL